MPRMFVDVAIFPVANARGRIPFRIESRRSGQRAPHRMPYGGGKKCKA